MGEECAGKQVMCGILGYMRAICIEVEQME